MCSCGRTKVNAKIINKKREISDGMTKIMRGVVTPRGPHFAPHPWVDRGCEVRTGDVNSILPHYARQIGKIFNYTSLNIELYHGVIQFCIGDVTL